MALALDRELAEFFNFLGHQVGLANVWIALSADHGVAPVPTVASKLHLPAAYLDIPALETQINKALALKFSAGKSTDFIRSFDYPDIWLNEEAFSALKIKEEDAERAAGDAMKQAGLQGYFTRWSGQGCSRHRTWAQVSAQLFALRGVVRLGIPAPFMIGGGSGTDHGTPYATRRSAGLLWFTLPAWNLSHTFGARGSSRDLGFFVGHQRSYARGWTSPLRGACASAYAENSGPPAEKTPRPARSSEDLKPAAFITDDGGQR